jgi:hypothetical protein
MLVFDTDMLASCTLSRWWFNLAFLKPDGSVISRYRACRFALPVAMVIAWHQGFRA